MLGRRTTAAILLFCACSETAKAPSSGCTATATYPDGTTLDRECIVEGESGGKRKASKGNGVSEELAWLKNTRWIWNNWREVIFRADGSFLAPAENCEREGNPKCRWSISDDNIVVSFGNAGLHTLTASDDQQSLSGSRDSDGDTVTAERR